MAFYKDAPGRKPQKNHSSGSWADEGSEYSGARKPANGGRSHGDKRYGDKSYGDKRYGDKPYGEKRYGDKPGFRKDDRRDNRSERSYDRKPARPAEPRPAPSFRDPLLPSLRSLWLRRRTCWRAATPSARPCAPAATLRS